MPKPKTDNLYRYLREAGNHPLLTRQEEKDLAKQIEEKGNKILWAVFTHDQNFLVNYLSKQDPKDNEDKGKIAKKEKIAEKVQRLLVLPEPEENKFYARLEKLREIISFVGVYREVGEKYFKKIKDQEEQLLYYSPSEEQQQRYGTEDIKIDEVQDQRKQLEELISAWKKHRDVLVQHNLRMVISPAKERAARSGLEILDCVNEGNKGLYRSVDGFDYRRENKFCTYATLWVKQSIDRYVTDNRRNIRLPIPFQAKISAIKKIEKGLRIRLGRENFTDEEIAVESLRLKVIMKAKKSKKKDKGPKPIQVIAEPTVEEIAAEAKKVRSVRTSFHEVDSNVSLESTVGDNAEPIKNIIPDRYSLNPEAELDRSERSKIITAALPSLSKIEQNIISRRFGIGYDREYTLAEIGDTYGLSRERIRQLEVQALEKLRCKSEIREIRTG